MWLGPLVLSLAAALSGGPTVYTVAPGDTLTSVSARFGVYAATIAADNQLDARKPLPAGRKLRIDNTHIVPAALAAGEIVVNVPQRMLFYREGDRVFAYPIAVGRTTWRTPAGPFEVVRMQQDPAWHVPESIRAESARREGAAGGRPCRAGQSARPLLDWSQPRLHRHSRDAVSVEHLPHGHARVHPAAGGEHRGALCACAPGDARTNRLRAGSHDPGR
jgi:LysM repeat protein